MADQEILPPDTTGTSLTIASDFTPVAVVTDQKQRTAFFERVKAELDSFVPDMTTAKGREAFASKAFDCNKAKAEIKRTVEALTEDWRDKTNKANAARKEIVDELEALRVNFRKPLTEWEEAEDARKKAVADFLLEMAEATRIGIDETSDSISAKAEALAGRMIDEATFGDSVAMAQGERKRVLDLYNLTFDRLLQAEEDKAKLARFEAAEAERREREAAYLAEQEEAARVERERQEHEQAAKDAAQAEADRLAAIAEKARADALREQQEATQRQLDEQQAEADRKLFAAQEDARIQREALEKERADREAEELRLAQEHNRQQAEAKAQREADEARQKNIEHRGEIMKSAKEALMSAADIDEPTAKKIVTAIVAGVIPHTSIQF
jgi:colicin import membrane protein